MWRPELTVAPVHKINSPQEVVVAAETVVAEEEEPLAGEAEEVDAEMVDGHRDHQRNHPIPRSIKKRLKVLPARYARNLATLLQRVGSGLRMVVQQIHLDEDQHCPEVENEVRTDQAVAHEEEEEEGSPRWL